MASLDRTLIRYRQARKATVARTTLRGDTYTLDQFAESVGRNILLSRVRQAHIERWLADLAERGLSRSTIAGRYSTVRTFWKWCVASDLVKRDPMRAMRAPKWPQSRPRSLKRAEVRALLAHASPRLEVAVLLATQEGLRRAEIVSLTVSSIDWDARIIELVGKGDKPRAVPLSDETAQAIHRYLTVRPASPHTPLIRAEGHRPHRGISPARLGQLTSDLFVAAGLKVRPFDGKSLHACRHTAANDILDKGADPRDVADFLGHSDTTVTLNVYGKRRLAVGRLREIAGGRTYGTLTT